MDCTCQAFDETWGSCKRQRREVAIAEGKKPLRLGGLGEHREKRTLFWTFYAKVEYIFGSC